MTSADDRDADNLDEAGESNSLNEAGEVNSLNEAGEVNSLDDATQQVFDEQESNARATSDRPRDDDQADALAEEADREGTEAFG